MASSDPTAGGASPAGIDEAPASTSPYWGDDPVTAQQDQLGRYAFAVRIADTIASRRDETGLVMAIYGAWGEGKTSVLHMVRDRLETAAGVVVMEFNPWMFRDADQLVRMFFESLGQQLKLKLKTNAEAFGEQLRRYGGVLGAATAAVPGVDVSKAIEGVAGLLGGEASLEKLKARIDDALKEAGIRPTIFIDDLDRLNRSEIQAVVRLVKLTAGFRCTTYVLAFDDAVVAAALADESGPQGEAAGRHYLEKIVQVPLRLPPADQSVLFDLTIGYLNEVLADVPDALQQQDAEAFVRYFQPLFEARPRTLRVGKRYANAIRFILPLLHGEANIGDLLLVEAIRTLYPELYDQIRLEADLFLGKEHGNDRDAKQREADKVRLERLLQAYRPDERVSLTECLEYLFPMLKGVTQNFHYGPDSREAWDRRQRVGSRNYFARYFQYAVPRSDIADRRLTDLDKILDAGDRDGAIAALKALCTGPAAGQLIQKLRLREEGLGARAAETLIEALTVIGGDLPQQRGMFASVLSPDAQGAILMFKALQRVLPERRGDVAVAAIRGVASLKFAVAFVRHLIREPKDQTLAVLAPAELEAAKRTLVEGLSVADDEMPLFARPLEEAATLMSAWGFLVPKDERAAKLRTRFQASPQLAPTFVASFVPPAWDMQTGLPVPSEFGRGEYTTLSEFVDPAVVLDALGQVHPDWLSGDDVSEESMDKIQEIAGRQFARVHKLVLQEQEAARANAATSGLGVAREPAEDGSAN